MDALRSQLEQLIETWNEMADFEVHSSNMQSALAYSQCAEEVAALVRAEPRHVETEEQDPKSDPRV